MCSTAPRPSPRWRRACRSTASRRFARPRSRARRQTLTTMLAGVAAARARRRRDRPRACCRRISRAISSIPNGMARSRRRACAPAQARQQVRDSARREGGVHGRRDPRRRSTRNARASASSRSRRNCRRTRSGSRPGRRRPSRVARPHRRDLRRGARGDRRRRASRHASLQPHVVDHLAIARRGRRGARIRRGGGRDHLRRPSRASRRWCRWRSALKSASRMMAITDATAVAGLPAGSRARLGDQTIIAGERTAVLEDGTLAGSILTMDGGVPNAGDARSACRCRTPRACARRRRPRRSRLREIGSIAPGKWADLAVLDRDLRVSADLSGRRTGAGTSPRSVYCPEVRHEGSGPYCSSQRHCSPGCEVNLNTEGLSARDSRPSRSPASPNWCSTRSTAPSSCTRGTERDRSRNREARDGAGAARRDQGRRAAAGRQDRAQGHRPVADRASRRHDRHAHLTDRAAARRGAAQHQHQRDQRRRLDSRRSDRRQASSSTPPTAASPARGSAATSRFAPATARFASTTPPASSISKPTDGSIGVEAKPTRAARCGPATARSASNIEPDTVMADNWDLTTSDGSVDGDAARACSTPSSMRKPATARCAPTIRCWRRRSRRAPRRRGQRRAARAAARRCEPKMGDGGKTFRIRTGDGTIRIER